VLEAVLMHLKNWFAVDIYAQTVTIKDGAVELPFLKNGQYYRICGSVFNDGLHKYGDSGDQLKDETFTGTVWALAIPKTVIELALEIEAWQAKNGEAAQSPYSSESFGGYTYTKATDTATGGSVTWQAAFRSQLNPWRKARETGPIEPHRRWGWCRGPH
jgi:hypothetical protein